MADLDTIFTGQGIASVNFFNDRVLTAEDLRDLASADQQHRRVIGRAIGEGIATGFGVTAAAGRSVAVGAGVAVNALGDVFQLPLPVTVDVGSAGSVASGGEDGIFTECSVSTSDPLEIGGAVYLLTVQPASTARGEAPRASLDGVAQACGPGYEVEGVRFRRVFVDLIRLLDEARIDVESLGLANAEEIGQLRSIVAHLYLGSPWLLRSTVDPLVDNPLRRAWALSDLEPCEVPLAIVAMQGSSLVFVEQFGVRRPPVGYGVDPFEESGRGWSQLTHAATKAAGLASQAQFQAQLAELLEEGVVPRAVDHFRFLPGAGIIPDPAPFTGVESVPFLEGLPHRIDLDATLDQVQEALRSGSETIAVDTVFPQTTIHVFRVQSSDPPYLLFVHGGHPLAREADLVDIGQVLTDLRTRVASLESDTDSPPGVTVTSASDVQTIRQKETIRILFRVDVKTAGRYRIADPTLHFKLAGANPPTRIDLEGPSEFETTDRDRRLVTVELRWQPKGGRPFERAPFPAGGRVSPRLVGGAAAAEGFDLADELRIGFEQPKGSALATVRLTVEQIDGTGVSDTGQATVLFVT